MASRLARSVSCIAHRPCSAIYACLSRRSHACLSRCQPTDSRYICEIAKCDMPDMAFPPNSPPCRARTGQMTLPVIPPLVFQHHFVPPVLTVPRLVTSCLRPDSELPNSAMPSRPSQVGRIGIALISRPHPAQIPPLRPLRPSHQRLKRVGDGSSLHPHPATSAGEGMRGAVWAASKLGP